VDPLSHALLGALGARSLTSGRGRVPLLAGAVGALLPDADVLIRSASDPLLTLEFHRQFSHSFAMAPVGALLAGSMLYLLLRRRIALGVLYLAALIGCVSALLLDACTSYGTQLLWPFSTTRYAWNVIPVVEPVMTALLLAGVLLVWRGTRVRGARIALALALAWLAVGWLQQERAAEVVATLAAHRGDEIAQQTVKPTLGNLLLWRSVYLSDGRYVVDAIRVPPFAAPKVYPGSTIERVTADDFMAELGADSLQVVDLRRFAAVSDGHLVRHPDVPDVIGDIRYSLLPDRVAPLWGIRIDPAQPAAHVELLSFRTMTREDRARFVAMLTGREL
jgi:inner membrane protein